MRTRFHLTNALLMLIAFVSFTTALPLHAASKPLKVYILAGQSNMEGQADIRTFDYVGEDPKTAPLLKMMRDADGNPTIAKNVWISNSTGFFKTNGVASGKLTVGYGGRKDPTQIGEKIGPEYTFGLAMQEAYDGPILIIKCAWGGKSLNTDFRSPSAGPYELNSWQLENYAKQEGHGIPKDFAQWKRDKVDATGVYYKMMVDHVTQVLADPKQVVPSYDAKAGYEIAGFVWFQGFNDMVDSHTYRYTSKTNRFAPYSELMAHFIRDVRKEFNAPKMPFVIGVMGIDGELDPEAKNKSQHEFREAMAAPAELPEFKDNVFVVQTAPYWSTELGAIVAKQDEVKRMGHLLKNKHKDYANADGSMSKQEQRAYTDKLRTELISPDDEAMLKRGASNKGYHYLGSAKTMAQIGQAFAEALIESE